MTPSFPQIAFTESVRAAQARYGARSQAARLEAAAPPSDRLGPAEEAFVASRDTLFLATVGEDGWPYVQHRGGPPGFLRVLDDRTIAFADYRGNRQYISVGHIGADDRVALLLVDFPSRRRLKVLARARLVEVADDPAFVEGLGDPDYRAVSERAFVLTVEAFDWNCPQHIVPRWTADEVAAATQPLRERITDLEAALEAARAPTSPVVGRPG